MQHVTDMPRGRRVRIALVAFVFALVGMLVGMDNILTFGVPQASAQCSGFGGCPTPPPPPSPPCSPLGLGVQCPSPST